MSQDDPKRHRNPAPFEQRRVSSRELGRAGEARVANWYVDRGYELIAQNWRCARGEIDLIVADGDVLVCCEVKARSSQRYGLPAEAVDWRKQQRLRKLLTVFLNEQREMDSRRYWRALRFDVAAVTGTHVEVIIAAF